MGIAIVGIVIAAVFFLAVFGVFYLRKVKGANIPDRPSSGPSMFAFMRPSDRKKKKQEEEKAKARAAYQRTAAGGSSSRSQHHQSRQSVANFSQPPHRSNARHYQDEEDEMEAPIPGLFDIPDYDNPAGPAPRTPAPAAVARNPEGVRSTRSAGDMGGGGVIDRRFPENPMPSGMPSILAQLQDPRIEGSLPATVQEPAANYSPYYGPMGPPGPVYDSSGNLIPPPPPPPPGSTDMYSVRPMPPPQQQNYDPRQYPGPYDPRQMAMADHYYRQQMQSMPHMPMHYMSPMPPILAYQQPPPQQAAPAQAPVATPAPVAMPSPQPQQQTGGSGGDDWGHNNRMTMSSPPAYSAL
ncbi:hypothetical protein GGI24_001178 [Coemansia furcata]|nr:hypothetical protein GGI24_001178 [Coemansia furcata]